jgi:hypothetical protein
LKKRKRLTDAEIRSTVEKIRERYGDYMVTYQKDRSALDSFEDRYISVLRARMSLELFLHAEMTAVEEIIQKEEERVRAEAEKKRTVVRNRVERQSIADRVMEENRQRILKYPRLAIHEDASEEVERLFGALGTIEREFWSDLQRLMRSHYTSLILSPRARIEEQLQKLCGPGASIPPRLGRYQSMFSWFPRKFTEIEKEAKKCMLEAAFFLHDLSDTLKDIASADDLSESNRRKVATMWDYVHNVLNDFRLKEFRNVQRQP